MKNQISHNRIIKIVKYFLIVFGTLVLGFLLFAFIVSTYYNEEVKEFFVAELNKNVQTEIIIGETDLSLLKNFPYATLSIQNVFAKDAILNENKDTLLFAKRVDLNFNIFNIFLQRYSIKGINVSDASLNIRVYDDYSNNYTFWKSSEDTINDAFEINLEKIKCNKLRLRYNHAPLHQHYDFYVGEGTLKGKFHSDNFTLDVDASAFVNKLIIDDISFLPQKKADINLLLEVNTDKESYNIKDGSLKVGEMVFNVTGKVVIEEHTTDLNLTIASNRLKLQDFIKEWPDQYRKYLDNYDASGIVIFDTKIVGDMGEGFTPYVNLNFELQDGSLTQKTTDVNLSELSVKGSFNNGLEKTFESFSLTFENFSAKLKQGQIRGQARVQNFIKPQLDFNVNVNADIKELTDLVYPSFFENVEGGLSADIVFNGKLNSFNSFTHDDFINSTCEGQLKLLNVGFSINNRGFSDVNSELKFNNNDIVIDSLSARYGSSDMSFKGYFRNALAYLFIPDEKVMIDASLFSTNLVIDEILKNDQQNNEDSASYKLSFSDKIHFKFRIFADNLSFEKFKTTNFSGNFTLSNKVLTAENISFNALDGDVSLSGSVDGRNETVLLTQCKALLNRCNITKLFIQLNNFGQENLTDKNLKGFLSASVDFSGSWSNGLEVNMPSIITQAQLVIENGELLGYGPIKELSRYVRVSDLNHIRFETLENTIDISNSCITIPHMDIKSDAVNISARGTHHFDNRIDYRLEVRLSELLGNKARRENRENEDFGVVQDDGLGGLTLFLKILGNVDNPVVSYDSRSAVSNVTTNFTTDVKNTIEKIREEFSSSQNDTISRFETEKEKERRRRRRENEIPDDFRIE
ncbi:MAG: AsmA-like C-terminal region-containing protein [Bacteroidales bacterium]|nr:AsmA-like C-terminal region-containing protein [Bacteroidales bacterium]